MIHVAEAQTRILRATERLGEETLALTTAAGRVLAQPLRARRNLPPTDNSAMDGYGLRAADVGAASEENPVGLPVAGAQLAGADPVAALPQGHAVRIMTGAPIPPGVDAVVMREHCDETSVRPDGSGEVRVRRAVPAGEAIRRRGEDVRAGDTIAAAGAIITPGLLNLLASAGHATLPVTRSPSVAIVASGDELRELGDPYTDEDILNSNAHAVAAAVRQAGGTPHLLGIARDDLEDHVARIDAGAFADVLITIGGVSMGTHDFVRPAFEQLGVALDFWKVALRPGKPLAFGRRGRQLVFGLPGNPVSSLLTFELFVRPTLRQQQGLPDPIRRPLWGTLVGAGMKKRPGVAFYARAHATMNDAGALQIQLEAKQGSGQISGLAAANALCVLEPERASVEAGERVPVLLLGDAPLWCAAPWGPRAADTGA